jgi:hypothetical protein
VDAQEDSLKQSVIVEGEIVCLDEHGQSSLKHSNLLFYDPDISQCRGKTS